MPVSIGQGWSIGAGWTVTTGSGGGGETITVNSWELGRVGSDPAFLQITCPNNTGPEYTTLATRAPGSQITLLPQNITVTCPNAPSTLSFLNRVTFTGLTGAGIPGGSGTLATGTQLTLL